MFKRSRTQVRRGVVDDKRLSVAAKGKDGAVQGIEEIGLEQEICSTIDGRSLGDGQVFIDVGWHPQG